MYSFYDYMQVGGMPQMKAGGDPDGEMAMGQIMAMHEKLSALQKFIRPDSDLEPWVASKLTLADDYLNSVADYMQYNPEESEEMEYEEEGLPTEQMMRGGGYVVTRSNDRKGKTHKVTGPDGTVKYFGDSKLGQHPKDPERKKAFYARHKKNLQNNPYFRAFARKTWEEGGELPEAGDGWIVPAAVGALALGTTLWANNKRNQLGQTIMPMLTGAGGMMKNGGSTFSGNAWYQGGGEPRTFWQTASQFVPGYETYLDVKDIVAGAVKGNKAQMNQGVIGLGQPFAGKAISGGLDYLTEKLFGKQVADEISSKREAIVNMSDRERMELFKRYGYGGYDKWVKAGKPKLEDGGIHINPVNKGKFTASAQAAGMGVQEFASHVLANKEDYSSTQVKRANFARNASKWKHQDGGPIEGDVLDVTPEQAQYLRQMGYDFETI